MKTDNQYLNERLKTADNCYVIPLDNGDTYLIPIPDSTATATPLNETDKIIIELYEKIKNRDNEIKKMIDKIELFKPCSQCGGEGKICIGEHFVSRDMAIDACDLSLEGQHFNYEYTQCNCAGGMIPKEIEEIQQEFTKLREKI